MTAGDSEDGFFGARSERTRVSVAHGRGPHDNTRHALARFDLSRLAEKRILLKPNAGRIAEPGRGVTTHPDVVAAAIDTFREAGAEVTVGESPITGVKTMEAFDATGIATVARSRSCPLVDMDERPAVTIDIPDGKAIHTLKVCAEVMEHDLVVSMPVMKMHMHTGVTLAVKNMKGCLWRRSKIDLHQLPHNKNDPDKPLNVAIADMASVLQPHFAIADGTVGMEGLGPSAGEPKPLNLVLAGPDAFAVDAIACRLMGTQAEAIPHLRIGAERGYGVIALEQIATEPENWELWAQPFQPPPQNLSIEFPNITVLDNNSCSGCQSTVLLFLRKYHETLFDYFPDTPVHVAIGKGHEDLPKGTLCIGNCTLAHKDRGIFVPGCPPVGSAILKALERARIPSDLES